MEQENDHTLEFQCPCVHFDRAKVSELQAVVHYLRRRSPRLTPAPSRHCNPEIFMDVNEVLDYETRILGSYAIDVWCSPPLSAVLVQEAVGWPNRYTGCCGLKTLWSLRNAVHGTTLVVRRLPDPASSVGDGQEGGHTGPGGCGPGKPIRGLLWHKDAAVASV